MTTRWLHDCTRCEFLGTHTINEAPMDFYRCETPHGYTALGRYGDEGREYVSMPDALLQQASDHGSTFATAFLHYYGQP